jgi:hypothetical protein
MSILKIKRKIMSILKIKRKSKLELQLEKLTPPRDMNWNWGKHTGGYKKQFSAFFVEYIFPYLLRNAREQGVSVEKMSLLDIGCGWAPLAIPFVIFDQSKDKSRGNRNSYLGIDIREDAIKWLTHAYADYPAVRFQWHQAIKEVDYIGAEHSQSKTLSVSDGQETKFKIPEKFSHNVQWSSSVFTHLTPQASLQALKSIKDSCAFNGIQVNTWLIIDEESKYALGAEIADRKLPVDCGDFLTYSEQNPLLCTAYKIEAIERMYADAGLDIIHIDRGFWRGPAYSNAANHYQDIVVSRVRRK